MSDIEKELQKPLDATSIKNRKKGGADLAYLESWFVIAEANRIFGHLGWCRETVMLECVSKETNSNGNHIIGYIAKVKVTVGDTVREGIGFGSGIAKNEADAHEGAVKEAESDAGKRALMTFGYPLGLALYDKERANVQAPIPDKIINGYKSILSDIQKIHDLVQIEETLSGKQYVFLEKNYPELASEIMNALQKKQNELNGVK